VTGRWLRAIPNAKAAASAGPCVDDNKRTAFIACELFLEANGLVLDAPDEECLAMTLGLAASEVDEAEFADWCARTLSPLPTQRVPAPCEGGVGRARQPPPPLPLLARGGRRRGANVDNGGCGVGEKRNRGNNDDE